MPLRVKRVPAALLASAAFCLASGMASAQTPAGAPFRVDSEGRSGLELTGVTLAHGIATLFWFSAPVEAQSGGPGRFLLRSFAAGRPINREQVLARDVHDLFSGSALAGNESGEIVAVWSHPPRPALDDTVFARRLGGPAGPRGFRVNSSTGNLNSGESAAMDATGRFVVGWTLRQDDGSNQSLAQSFTAAGERLGPEIQLNETLPTDIQRSVSLATIPAGFVAVWVSPDSSGTGIYGRRFSPTGEPLEPETAVNQVTLDDQSFPAVASDAAGNFIVVWQSAGQDGSVSAIYGQRFAADGTRIGDEVRLSDPGVTTDETPVVAGNAQGDFVVAWDDQVHSWFRLVCHDGSASQLVQVASSRSQRGPKVAFDRNAFVVAWNEEDATTLNSHVWARLFSAAACSAP